MPGDVVEIKVGDMVPADCRVLQLKTVTVGIEQMSLTGESATVRKETSFINGTNPEIQLKTNMVFAGTVCSNGHMVGVVQSTGMRTEIGKVQAAVQGAAKENEDEKTPLGEKLDDFSDQLMYLIGLVCALVWLLKYNEWLYVDGKFTFNGKSCLENFQVAVASCRRCHPRRSTSGNHNVFGIRYETNGKEKCHCEKVAECRNIRLHHSNLL